jgi:hypothetical protein
MFPKKLFPLFIFLFVSVLFFSCKKEKEEVFQSFDLEVKYEDGVYHLSWTPVNISTFEKYIIAYNMDTDPFSLDDNHTNIPSFRKEELTDQAISTFVWDLPPDSEKIFFQVFVLFEGREIASNIVEFENVETDVIDLEVDEIIHYPEKDALYCFDFGTKDMRYYNYKTREIIASRKIGFNFSATAVGDNGFGEEIYLVRNATDVIVLDANTLEEKYIFYSGSIITSIATNGKGWIVLAVSNSSESIKVLERSTWEIITELDYSNDSFLHGVAFLSGEDNILVESTRYNVYRYEFDNDGGYVSYSQAPNPHFSQSNNTNLVVSPTGNYFVNSRYGELFDSSLNEVDRMYDATGEQYAHYVFGESGTVVYGITLLGSTFEVHVDKIDLTTGIFKTFDIINSSPHFLFLKDGKVMLVTLKGNETVIIRPLEN